MPEYESPPARDGPSVNKKGRAPIMCKEELCIISQHYMDNYEVFHAALAGSTKRRSLEQHSDVLVESGFPCRTTTQLDQRIRDTLRRTKKYAADRKSEYSKTGGDRGEKLEEKFYSSTTENIATASQGTGPLEQSSPTSRMSHVGILRTLSPVSPLDSRKSPTERSPSALSEVNVPKKMTDTGNLFERKKKLREEEKLLALEEERIKMQIANERKRAQLLEVELQNAHWTQLVKRKEFAYWERQEPTLL